MAGHTSGPWTVVRYGDGTSLVIHSDSESRVCFMATPGSHGDPAKIEADARLIASAPDLLEALNKIAESADDGGQDQLAPDMWAACREIARAAISKATP